MGVPLVCDEHQVSEQPPLVPHTVIGASWEGVYVRWG